MLKLEREAVYKNIEMNNNGGDKVTKFANVSR